MTREELTNLLGQDFSKVKATFSKMERKVGKKTIEEVRKQYDPLEHDVMNPLKRPDDIIEVPTGEKVTDALTGQLVDEMGEESVPVARLPIPDQKKIVLISATFMVGEKIELEANPEGEIEEILLDLLKKVWFDNKLDFKSKHIAKLRMSETHCAELWYDYQDKNYWNGTINAGSTRKIGINILSESNGDRLYPVRDQYNDMIAFGRGYTLNENGKNIEHFDITTAEWFYKGVKNGKDWTVTAETNPYGAINIIYHDQPAPEWWDVQPLINRKETFFSNFADSNDQFAFPALLAKGKVDSLPSPSKVGKLFEVEMGGDVNYITKDNAPESMRMELDILDREIHSGTHTPDISFETMKQLLGNVSGIALKMLFMDAQMKASDSQEYFGECIQRRLNLLKKMIISFNPAVLTAAERLTISPKFRPYMPVNDVEFNNLLMTAYKSGMISQRTMVEMSTLVKDADKELTEILKDEEKAQAQSEGMQVKKVA